MNDFFERILRWLGTLKFWYMVLPWQTSMRIRIGKHRKVFDAGYHFKIPFLDAVFILSNRTLVSNLPLQTVTTKDGITITVSCVAEYRVYDIEKTFMTTTNIEDWITNRCLTSIAEYLGSRKGSEISFDMMSAVITSAIEGANVRGLLIERVAISDFSKVRTYRLIQDSNNWYPNGSPGHDGPIP